MRTFENFILSHFDSDIEFARALGWDDSKFSRIKKGKQIPKITDVNDIAKITHTPLAEVAQFFFTLKS